MPIDTQRVILDFHRSADIYEKEAQVQWQIMSVLLELFLPYAADDARVLDIGCGTGWLSGLLQKREVQWRLHGLDIAEAMCRETAAKGTEVVRGDAESLPFGNDSMDGIFSSLCVQWLKEPRRFLEEAKRAVKPGGRIAVATLAQRTLHELRDSFSQCGEEKRVMAFRSEFDWLTMALECELTIHHMHTAVWKYPYRSMLHLCQSLRGIGAVNKREDRKRTLTGAALFEQAKNYYETAYARPHGTLGGKPYGGGVWASWQPLWLIFEKPA